jgi:hypothetical protein
MDYVAALLIVVATAAPPDFSREPNLRVLAPAGLVFENAMAMSGNTVVIAAIDHDEVHPIEIYVSRDRGLTWSAPARMPFVVDGAAFQYSTDPALTVLDDGSFGLTYLVLQNPPALFGPPLGEERLLFLRSADGVTWSAPVTLATKVSGSSSPAIDRPWVLADRVHGIVYATWSRNENGQDVVLQTSADRGATWSAPAAITAKGEAYGRVAALEDGTLAAIDFDMNRNAYVVRHSSGGGAQWSTAQTLASATLVQVSSGTKTQSPPMADLIANRGQLYAVLPTVGGIFFTRSGDGGATWSPRVQLGGQKGDAVLPSLAADDAPGTIYISWMDGRDDASNTSLRLYGTRSADGGATFETPRAFSPPFASTGRMADVEETIVFGDGTALRGFSPLGGYLTAARLTFVTRRRAANH